jgi:hypothetical protein
MRLRPQEAPRAGNTTGWQADGSYLTPEGRRLTTPLERAAYLRTVQDWIIRPQLKGLDGVAGVDAIGGYVKQYHVQPDPMKLVSYGLTFQDLIEALEKNNVSTGAGYIEHKGEAYLVRADGRITNEDEIASIVISTKNGTPLAIRDVATVGIGQELRTGSASEDGEEVVVGTALMLIGANSRTVAAAVDKKFKRFTKAFRLIFRRKPCSTARNWLTPRLRRSSAILLKAPSWSSWCFVCCWATFAPPLLRRSPFHSQCSLPLPAWCKAGHQREPYEL